MKSTLTRYQARQSEKLVAAYAKLGLAYELAVYLLAQTYEKEGIEVTVANLRRPFLPMERKVFSS